MTRRPIVTPLIILINILVFFCWVFADGSDDGFMAKNFLVSETAVLDGRVWTLVTSVFSHNMFLHLFVNKFVFFGFGSVVERTLGRAAFLRFYLGAGIVASICHILVSTFILGQPELPALGASGAIAGVVVVFALLYPREKIYFFGFIPVPAIWGALFAVGLDVWGLVAQTRGGGFPIGYGAHIGGAVAGAFYFLLRRRTFQTPPDLR